MHGAHPRPVRHVEDPPELQRRPERDQVEQPVVPLQTKQRREPAAGARKQIEVVARVRDREAAARTGCEVNVDRARRRFDRKLLDLFPAEQPRQGDAPNDASVAEALHAVRRSAQDHRARPFGVPHRIDDVTSHRERERGQLVQSFELARPDPHRGQLRPHVGNVTERHLQNRLAEQDVLHPSLLLR